MCSSPAHELNEPDEPRIAALGDGRQLQKVAGQDELHAAKRLVRTVPHVPAPPEETIPAASVHVPLTVRRLGGRWRRRPHLAT